MTIEKKLLLGFKTYNQKEKNDGSKIRGTPPGTRLDECDKTIPAQKIGT